MRIKKAMLLAVVLAFAFSLAACQDITTTTTTTSATTATTSTTTATTSTTTTTTATTTTTTATTTATTTSGLQNMSILNGWVDSGDGVHTIVQSATELSVTYDKQGFSWASMVYEIDEDLSVFNKLVFAISGSGTLLVKIQGVDTSFEVSIQLTAGQVTYQLNLRDYDEFLGGVTGVYLFAGPGKAQGTGNFTITQFAFNEGTAYGTVLEDGDSNIPLNELEYDGTGETFEFKTGFVDNGDGIYTIDKSGDDPLVSYTKAVGFEWAYMIATVKGAFSDFDFVVLNVKGVTAGAVMFKAELSSTVQKEIAGTFAIDEEITLVLDLSEWTDAQLDALTKILIFAAGGSATGSGEFEIQSAYFSKVSPIVEPNYDFMTGWVENDLSTYTFTEQLDGSLLVDYTKGVGQSWAFMKNDFDSELAAGFNTMTFTVMGTAGKSIMIKPNDSGALEQTITFTGEEQTVVVTAYAFTKMMIFAEPGTESVNGSFTIISAKLTYVEPDALDASVVYDFNGSWVGNDEGIYTFTNTAGIVTIDYSRIAGQEWSFIKNVFLDNLSNHDTIVMIVKGTAGAELIIKPNDNSAYEQTVTFTGEEQIITFTLTDAPERVLMFVDPNTGSLTGSFQIISAKVTSSASGIYDFTTDFTESDPDTYGFTILGGGTLLVDYTKAVGQGWVYMSSIFDAEDVDGLNTMTIVLKGTLGKSVLLKPNDDGALEVLVNFTGEEQTVVVTYTAFTKLIIFAEAGVAEVNGSFQIISATLSYVQPSYDFTQGWIENDVDTYDFTVTETGSTIVDYTKGATQQWIFMRNNFTVDAEGFNTLTLVVKGTLGKSIMIKPNDSGALEKTIVFTGEEQTVVVSASAFTTMLIFAEPGTASVSGSFEIISAKLTYTAPDSIDPWVDVILGNSWVDNDGGIYTFTEVSGAVQVDWVRTVDQKWAFIIYTIEDNLSNHDTLTMVLNGTAGQQVIIKPNDNSAYEQTVTFTGADQTIVFNLTDTLVKILMFVDPNNGSLSGSFTIKSAVVTSAMEMFDFTNSWVENDANTYSFTLQEDDSVLVSYTKTASQTYVYMKSIFIHEEVAGFNTMTLVLKGTSGLTVLLKPNDLGATEQTLTFDGTEQTVTFTATEFTIMLIFAEPGTASVSGTFEIISATLTHVDPE